MNLGLAYPPAELRLIINSTFKTTTGFNEQNIKLNEIWCEQHLLNKKFGYRIGRIDIMSMMNNFSFDRQNYFFLNNMITSHPAVAAPDNFFGFVFVSNFFNSYTYLSGGITNAHNGAKDSEFK